MWPSAPKMALVMFKLRNFTVPCATVTHAHVLRNYYWQIFKLMILKNLPNRQIKPSPKFPSIWYYM